MTRFLAQTRLSADPWRLYQAERQAVGEQSTSREGFYCHMLLDDLGKLRYAYEVSFVPNGLGTARASEILFALLGDFDRTGYSHNPAALVCDFASEFLKETQHGGALLVELHSLPNPRRPGRREFQDEGVEGQEEGDPPESMPSLGFIPGWSVKETRSGYSQLSRPEQRTIQIPRTRVHRLGLSRGYRAAWSQSVKRLQLVDANKLFTGGIERFSWEGYSFSEVVEIQSLAVAASTAAIGWDGRGVFGNAVTSPYMTFRRLRFAKFWVSAMEQAVDFLNRFTTSEALYAQEAFSFSLKGLPTTTELAQAMEGVRAGTLTVDQAHDSFLFPKYNAGAADAATTG